MSAFVVVSATLAGTSHGQTQAGARTASSRMQSIGSSGLLEAYRSQVQPQANQPRQSLGMQSNATSASYPAASYQAAGYRGEVVPTNALRDSAVDQNAFNRPASSVQQTVWMQQMEAPPFNNSAGGNTAGGGISLPSMGLPSNSMPNDPVAPGMAQDNIPESAPYTETAPRALPSPGPSSALTNTITPSPSDLVPMEAPALQSNGYARMDNCALITPPSQYQYMAASVYGGGCGTVAPMGYAAVAPVSLPPEVAAPVAMPPAAVTAPVVGTPLGAPATAAPARALISLGQDRYMVQVGQGLWGQPVAYVPGQGLRNWLRYLSP
ncbi:hypothetical protein LOC67_22885 [Stieleria sp. JC731]|uniref:hypothetical protein n=1 Tax=Pirellulaceae TaxID=2691357 RepID=UPI001E46F832|nr:hypothetical protein [Stieleria sp. JC731]MCC9603405.1 hypothetical protein [Stieleria sp. JC731]